MSKKVSQKNQLEKIREITLCILSNNRKLWFDEIFWKVKFQKNVGKIRENTSLWKFISGFNLVFCDSTGLWNRYDRVPGLHDRLGRSGSPFSGSEKFPKVFQEKQQKKHRRWYSHRHLYKAKKTMNFLKIIFFIIKIVKLWMAGCVSSKMKFRK